ncbi:hypothetical protein BCR35DRAFT_263071 [Leucosporidium creatinivorum]|uniref:Macrofage activating glycoprotein n=1 Tax=Leucosporidium creatinivorum TaxID=106004 RepID=A0A1Y2FXU7_9BASI|nr:hypothetical protein BCR35DRAFT_263071 [Leucosporidium creatinivorum]
MVLAPLALVATLSASLVAGQTTALAAKRFNYTNLPYQADTDTGERGTQSGYNRCNATTAGPDSLCQTAIINSLDDFCLWGPQEAGGVVGNIEGEMVAWCTQGDKYGARTIPAGALQGVTFVKTPHYVQVTGFIDQSMIDIASDDDGGEMDPHGADNRGNPLGGLLFTQAFNGNLNSTAIVNGSAFTQVIQWHNFMGANVFCLKACDPSYEDDYAYCEHIYDRVGCNVNAPMDYKNGTYESCLGDDQLPPGVYVEGGVTSTFVQPPEGQVISTLPYVPFTPSSSSCTTFSSAELYVTASVS